MVIYLYLHASASWYLLRLCDFDSCQRRCTNITLGKVNITQIPLHIKCSILASPCLIGDDDEGAAKKSDP